MSDPGKSGTGGVSGKPGKSGTGGVSGYRDSRLRMLAETYSTNTAYPMHAQRDGNGALILDTISFSCAAHGRNADCADCGKAEQGAFAAAAAYSAYVSIEQMRIETFGGFPLARITRHRTGRRQLTPGGGSSWQPAWVTAVAPDGTAWHGTYNEEGGTLITLRRSRPEPVPVIFRKWGSGAGNDVIALFPAISAGRPGLVRSFDHGSQHGPASYAGVMSHTRAATPEEYASLKRELESPPYSYVLLVRKRARGGPS
jgi:hypothetical protein